MSMGGVDGGGMGPRVTTHEGSHRRLLGSYYFDRSSFDGLLYELSCGLAEACSFARQRCSKFDSIVTRGRVFCFVMTESWCKALKEYRDQGKLLRNG